MKPSSNHTSRLGLPGSPIRNLVATGLASLALTVTCGAATFVSFQENDVRTNSDPYTVSVIGDLVTNVYNMGATYLRSNTPTTVQDGNQILLGFNGGSPSGIYRSLFAFDVSYLTNIVGMATSRVDSVALLLTSDGAGTPATKDMSVHLTNPFDETTATWNSPHFGAGPTGGVVGVELRRQAVTCNLLSPNQAIWGSPNLLWPSSSSTPDGLVDAVRAALASGSNTVYFLAKRTVESVTAFARIKGDNNATVDHRPELRVGIDSAGLVGNSVGVVATVPQVRQSDTINPGKFSIYRTGDTNSTATVSFSYSGTAVETVNYNWAPFTNPPSVTLVPGQTNAEVTITPIATDPTSGPDRTVILNLAAVAGYIVGPTFATVTITPDALATYRFNENNNDTSLTLSAVATGTVVAAILGQVTANNAAAGSGLGVFGNATAGVASHYYLSSPSSEYVSAPSALTLRGNTLTNNLTDAIAGNDYLSFTIAPKPGAALNHTGMGFQTKVPASGLTANMVLRSSLNNFASDLGSFSKTGDGAFSFVQTSFSDPGFTQAFAPIEFRLYFYSSDLTNASQALRVEDLVFYGTTTNLPAGVQQLTVTATGNAAEPNVTGCFTLTRGGSVASPLTVNYTLGGTATNGVHYQTLSGTTNFAAAQTNIVIPVVPIDNSVIDPGKTVVLTVATNAAYTLLSSSATVAIADDDAVTVSLTNSIPVAYEAGPVAGQFTLSRTGNTNAALTVYYTIAGTATNGAQYQTLSGAANFVANATTATIAVTPIADGIPSPARTVILTLANNPSAPTYYLAAPTNGTVTIIDNNDPAQLNVFATDTNAYERVSTLTGSLRIDRYGDTNSAFTANFSFGGTAVLGTDYASSATGSVSFAAGDISQTIVISPIDNALLDGNRTVTLNLQSGSGYSVGPAASATTTIVDDELPSATVLWSDNFDSLTSSNNYSLTWAAVNAVADYFLDFAVDYSTANIPPAPGSTNTIGLVLTVNKNDALASAAAVNVYPNGQSFSGDFALRFNLLCHHGTTNGEQVLFGINQSGTNICIGGNNVGRQPADTGDGLFVSMVVNEQNLGTVVLLAVTNGSSPSPVAALAQADLSQLLQQPPFTVAGSPANAAASLTKTWVDVELAQTGSQVVLKLNNTPVLQFTNTTAFTNGNVMLGYTDQFQSIGSTNGYAVVDNVRVVRLVASVTQPVITKIGVAGGTVTINFTGGASDTPAQFALQSSATVNGTFADDNSAVITGSGGVFQVTTAASGATRFYKIRR